MRYLLVLFPVLCCLCFGQNEASPVYGGSTLPLTCWPGQTYFKTNAPGGANMYGCTATNTWMVQTGGAQLPSGLIVLSLSACPTGFTEVSALNGVTIIGTLAANGNVGTGGGSDTITPSGSVTAPVISWPAGVPTISGIAVANHASHTHTYTDVVNHIHPNTAVVTSQGGTTAATTGTHGMTSTATGGSARALTSGDLITVTNVNPTGGVATGTTAGPNATLTHTVSSQGTIAWPAGVPTNTAPAFTGNQFDNRPAFIRAIFCSKN